MAQDYLSKNQVKKTKYSIMVVDDQPLCRSLLKIILKDQYTVQEACNGVDALQKMADHTPDLIIADLMMPKMDGYEFLDHVRASEEYAFLPFIMLSAKTEEQHRLKGLRKGADDYLAKPLHAEEIQLKVENIFKARNRYKKKIEKHSLPEEEDEIFACIQKHLTEDHFNVEALAIEMHMSISSLRRFVKKKYNTTPISLIRNVRLDKARYLLTKSAGTVSVIAFAVGFNNLSYFSKHYKARFGELPSGTERVLDGNR